MNPGRIHDMNRFLQLLFLLGCCCSSLAANAASITVFAAASLTDSLKEIGTAFEKQTGQKVVFNFGASSILARQIQEGAPADVFFSADEARMNVLEKQNLILKETRSSRLGNSLVIVTATNTPLMVHSATDLTNASVKKIALGDPRTVPAGIYSREYLEKLNLWSSLESKIVPMDNVRAALAAVESGNVEAGIVYKTDAAISKKIEIAHVIPPADTPNISYPVAVVKDSQQVDMAKQFVAYLNSEEAKRVFVKYGFSLRK
jgi:molybdate transport system substrate-binding protein